MQSGDTSLRISASRLDEAEALIVKLWMILESFNLPTPEVAVRGRPGKYVLEIRCPRHREMKLIHTQMARGRLTS